MSKEMDDLVGCEVRVTWDDACFEAGEVDPQAMRDEYPMRTRGVVVRVTERSLFIASEDSPGFGILRAVTRIPWASITDIEGLTPPAVVEPIFVDEGLPDLVYLGRS